MSIRFVYLKCVLLISLLCCSPIVFASHIYGGELYYTHNSGSLYTVTLVLYGDCEASSSLITALYTATPEVRVSRGTTSYRTMYLKVQPGAGTEVTPVCPKDMGNTVCNGGLIPGVRRFIYSDTISLPAASLWTLRFRGNLDGTVSSGRSTTITNISSGSTMVLEATLNNLSATNSNPTFTTIPTPFYCINVAQQYNQGSVDANGDSLVYELVDGLDYFGTVTYGSAYSATAPMAVSAGSFSFNKNTGQLHFKPNLVQRSLVVCRVSEYRAGVLVGTTMREMVFVVLASCSNRPPAGSISGVSGGTLKDSITVNVCKDADSLSFSINPTDADGDTMSASVAGLPAGAVMTISGNGTKTPSAAFNWKISGVAPGTYYFYMTYQDIACPLSSRQTIAYTINVLPLPAFGKELVSAATCTRKAVFRVTPLAGTAPWTMQLISAGTVLRNRSGITGTVTDSLAPGTYTIRLQSNGCSVDSLLELKAPDQPAITVVRISNPLCYGGTDGSVSLDGAGGLAPYTYASGSAAYGSSATFSGLAAGTYTFHLKDANSCVKDTTLTLSGPAALAIDSFAELAPACSGGTDGSLLIRGKNTIAPYTYALGSGAYGPSEVFSGLSAGSYTLHIRDANNCQKDTLVTLTAPASVHVAAFSWTPVSCAGYANGILSFSGSGGTAPYTYALGSGGYGSSGSFGGLAAGTYVLHIRDAHNCQKDTTVMLTAPLAVGIGTFSQKPVSCAGGTDGTVTVSGSGGTAPYTYALGGGSYGTSGSFSGLGPGSYTLHIRDASNCQKDTTISIVAPAALQVGSLLLTAPLCAGGSDGVITITATGGTAAYTYSIGSGTFSGSGRFPARSAGSYALHMQDANGCTKDTTVTLADPPALLIGSVTMQAPACAGGSDARITVTATGTVVPYTYAIGSGSYGSSGTFGGLKAGTYVVHARDAHGCQKDTTVTVSDRSPLLLSYSVKKAMCKGIADGRILLSASGGKAPYTYAIGSGAYGSSPDFGGLAAGSYVVSVRDSLDCSGSLRVEVGDSVVVRPVLSVKGISCFGSKDAIVEMGGKAGSAPYTYSKDGGTFGSSAVFGDFGSGTYVFTTRDVNGCTGDTTITLTDPPLLRLAVSVSAPTCAGYEDGQVSLAGAGGTPGYLYGMSPGAPVGADPVFKGLVQGKYIFSVADRNGCRKDTNVSLSAPSGLVINATFTTPSCAGKADGEIRFSSSGGSPAYTYSVDGSGPSATDIFRGIAAGSRSVSITDSKGCRKDSVVVVTAPLPLSFVKLGLQHPSCEAYKDGSVTVAVSGGTPLYRYRLVSGSWSSDTVISGLAEGTQRVEVTDANGCTRDTAFTLTGYPHILAQEQQVQAPTCFGYEDGSFRFTATGGVGQLNYVINGRTDTLNGAAAYERLAAGVYLVTVTDEANCRKTFEVKVPEAERLQLAMSVLPNNCIGPDTSGAITVQVTGGTAPYRYLWANGHTEPGIYNLPNGLYSVQVTDRNECRDSASAEVINDNCCMPAIPNAFTPNNDSHNDVFRIIYKGDVRLKEFSIYNRYGQRVFSTTDISVGWDGTFNGQQMDLGTYYYYLRLLCGNNQEREVQYKGDVILIR